jgi:hypothetical protein
VGHFDVLHGSFVLSLLVAGHGPFVECLYILSINGQGFSVDQLCTFPLLLVEAAGTHVEEQVGRKVGQLLALRLRGTEE